MASEVTIRRAWEALEPHLEEQGYELVEVEFGQHGSVHILRLFIDCAEGVTIGDCQKVSRLLGPVLDAADFISQKYTLEVSSPGFERPVRKPKDFERFAGERVKVQTHSAVDGRRKFTGLLKGCVDGMVIVECEGVEFRVHLENLQRAKLDR